MTNKGLPLKRVDPVSAALRLQSTATTAPPQHPLLKQQLVPSLGTVVDHHCSQSSTSTPQNDSTKSYPIHRSWMPRPSSLFFTDQICGSTNFWTGFGGGRKSRKRRRGRGTREEEGRREERGEERRRVDGAGGVGSFRLARSRNLRAPPAARMQLSSHPSPTAYAA